MRARRRGVIGGSGSVGGGGGGGLLKWAPPSGYLSYPTFSPTSSNRTHDAGGGNLRVIMPAYAINQYIGIYNVANLVIIGGEIYKPTSQNDCTSSYDVQEGYCFDIRGVTGTVHLEGLKIWGPGSGQCVFMQHADNKPNQDWRIQNCFLEAIEPVGSNGSHSDCIQAAGGPQYLRVYRCSFHAQGNAIQTQPWDNWASPSYRAAPLLHEFYDIDVVQRDQNLNCADHRPPGGGYALWKSYKDANSPAAWPCHFSNCWIDVYNGPEATYNYTCYAQGTAGENPQWGGWRAPGSGDWAGKITGDTAWNYGVPAAGKFCPASSVGIGYVSPGYL
jgi:hypothetical protein